jgi:hypothetical protein
LSAGPGANGSDFPRRREVASRATAIRGVSRSFRKKQPAATIDPGLDVRTGEDASVVSESPALRRPSYIPYATMSNSEEIPMCDYSLNHVASRPAKVGDKLVTTNFGISVTRGFAAIGERNVAVCLLPGTELAFDHDVEYERMFFLLFGSARINHKVARFRQVDLLNPHVHHDALEFPDGRMMLVTRLVAGQHATVLQLPSARQLPDGIISEVPDWVIPAPSVSPLNAA